MNKIYRLKFDKRRNELVVVSEITAGMGKEKSTGHIAELSDASLLRKLLGTLTPLSLLTGFIIGLFPGMVLAADLPAGGQIVGGQGSISTSGNQMTIHQQTHNMATNWHSFDVGKNSTVQFVQPDSSSVALNRVTGGSGSQIMGTLKANGQVFILNPNGVLFGKDARVNVAGLVASTKNINTADFMKGQYTLSGEGQPGAQVVNQGSLTTAKGGYIVLAGERVSNSGVIATPSGKTVLAAGKTVTLQLDNGGLTSVSVNGSVVNALVENRGLISATSGQVYLTAKGQDMLLNTVVNNSGTVEAKGLASRGGEIVLNGDDSGVVSQSGRLLADSQTGPGGKITLEGQNIHLAGGSLTSATGKTGGGEVYVGGGWQGKDSRIRNAARVVMDKTATVDVSATDTGNGGTAVLWSDDYTGFRGTILAQGGSRSGNGGQVETSSHRILQASGAVDASARAGHGGAWLLDPADVTIVGTGSDTGMSSATADGTDIFTPTVGGAQILNTSIENQLNAGTNVTIKTSGVDIAGQSGNITLNANISKSAGADAALTLAAEGNITLNAKSITSTVGKLDVTLLAAGSDSGLIQVVNGSKVSSNGGNITLDQLNPSPPANDGSRARNPNALTVKVNNSVLNASAADATKVSGDILISARNPNVNLSQSQYTKTVRNAGVLTELSGNSALSGRDLVIHTTLEGGNASGLPVYLNNATLTATRDITLSGTSLPVTTSTTADDGTVSTKTTTPNVAPVELRGEGNVLTATGGNITIENQASGNNNGIYLNGSASGKAQLTALNGTITLNGGSGGGTGVLVSNSILNASQANITGSSDSGTGFSLTNSTLTGALADLANVTLSSSGSGIGVVNVLDSSIVTDASRDNLLLKRIENMTTVDMNGTAIFDDSAKGWKDDYTSVDTPNGGWIFNNTSVTAGGDVELKGASFTNATVTVSNGSLTLDNGGAAPLTGSTITVNDGAVSVHAGAGDIDLTKGNITAKKNITVVGDNGSVTVVGTSATAMANITSEDGGINISGTTLYGYGVKISNVNLSAINGNIKIHGKGAVTSEIHQQLGAVTISGKIYTKAKSMNVYGFNSGPSNSSQPSVGVYLGDYYSLVDWDMRGNDVYIYGESPEGGGVYFGFNSLKDKKNTFNVAVNNLSIEGKTSANFITTGSGTGGIVSPAFEDKPAASIFTLQNKARLTLTGNASNASAYVQGITTNTPEDIDVPGWFIFSGDGCVSINGMSNDGDGLRINGFDNTGLKGLMIINGQSNSGDGVHYGNNVSLKLVNATINGESKSGTGILITSDKTGSEVNFNGNTFTGTGASGITINGNNVTLSNGTLNGTVTSGNGVGVMLTGGSNYTLDSASVTGTSADGVGVAVNGTLTVNNGTALEGHATGSGIGVLVSGNLATDSGDGISINGTAVSGDGIKVDGETALMNATLTGHTDSGAGINVAGNLTTDSATRVEGHAASGTGVNLGASLTGASVLGVSDAGAGVQLADNAVVTQASLSGTSTTGDGVAMTGNVTLDDTTAATLNASSVNGTGLKLADNADVSILNITTVTQEKKDADGNPVLDAGGKPVTETVTTQNPVTTPVMLTGTSEHGTGVATGGNVSISGIVLNGNTSADGGTGVSLGGNLTIADAISGVTAGATGNGTALVVDNANIHSDGYTYSGKDFVINASVSGNGTAIKTQGSNQLGDVVLNGTASNGGTAVELGGQVSGADITGTSDSGTAVRVSDGAKIDGGVVQGHSDSGTGLNVSGNATLSNTGLSGTTQTGAGASVTGNLTADGTSKVAGEAALDGGTGVGLAGTVTGGKLEGTSTSGDAVHIADGSVLGDATVTGNATTGTGLNFSGNATLSNTGLSGTSQTGAGAAVSGSVTADDHSVVSGEATADGGTGVSVSGAMTGGKVTGTSTTGDAVHMADGAQINNAEISGTSQDGAAIRTEGQVSVSGSHLRGDSVNGSDIVVSGTLSHDPDTTIDAKTVTGQENIQEVKPVEPPPASGGSDSSAGGSPSVPSEPEHDQNNPAHGQNPEHEQNPEHGQNTERGYGYPASFQKQAEVNSLRQGAENAQVTQMNRASQDGFHAAGSPPVPVSDYQPAEQTVDISLCDGSDCQSESLNAGRPAQGRAKTSGR
ncbi:filamentous hemagglutinin N-terminal domain-containing protein [Salmonella enterica]|nr:filamentous hemagglutinin N-terminal domain-containing protein [Salmonella enterica]